MNKSILMQIVLLLNITAFGFYFGVTAYLGRFTRHLADDYCESVMFHSGRTVENLINRYFMISDRYSNILFVGLTELAGPAIIRILPFIMIVLWLAGLVWLFLEINKLAGFGWPSEMALCLALLLAFLAAYQAPNHYQIFYWRSGMATHFAPLVFLNFLVSFLLRQIRLHKNGFSIPLWVRLTLFLGSFIIGGFSEPPAAVMITGAVLVILYLILWGKGNACRPALQLFAWFLAGAMLALFVMAMSPANSLRVGDIPPTLEFVIVRIIRYTYSFIADTFQSLPLPTLISIIVPALLFYSFYQGREDSSISWILPKLIWVAPLILILFVAAGFSPSAYGQSYPVERARFFAHYQMTAMLMFEGALIGIRLSRCNRPALRFPLAQYGSLFALAVLFSYPLRAGWQLSQSEPEYRTRTELWDARNAYLIRHAALGEKDLAIPQFPGMFGIKEWDVREDHWVNRCASEYYGVNSIRVVPVPDDYLKEFFNE